MSLAMSAEIINSNEPITPQQNSKRRHSNNITQKQKSGLYDINSSKVNNVLNAIHNNNNNQSIHQNIYKEDDLEDDLNYYSSLNKSSNPASNIKEPSANYSDRENVSLLKNAYMNDSEVNDYYKRVLSSHNTQTNTTNKNQSLSTQIPQYSSTSTSTSSSSNDVLIDKLNYMIHLLEEQQDQRINNVTEEIILYSFLGIFIIFIVDSFARSGKYIR